MPSGASMIIPPGITATLDGKKLTVSKAYEYKAFAMVVLSYTFPKISQATPEHTHVYTDWQYNFGQHYKHCTDCDEIFFLEAHKGGVATCEEPGRCTVCGYAYIEPSEDYHVPDTSKWIARVDMYHYYACSICGAHCDIADHRWSPKVHPVDATGHAYQCADCKGYDKVKPHNPGPAATEDKPQTCKDCGYVIKPATNHVHDLTRVPQTPASCTEGGNIEYYFCTGCNDCFTDPDAKNKIPETMTVLTNPLGHKASDQWHISEHHHWRTCSTCGVLLEETQMLHEGDPCATCGYAAAGGIPQETEPIAPIQTEATEPIKGKSGHQMTDTDWLWVIVGAVAGAAAGGLSVILLLKKKKK